MSGHSKWSTIKRKKGALDERRGQLFTKISKMITIAAQQGGGDMDMNFSLRLAVDKAKAANMPKDNIERAIKKGIGEQEGEALINVTYEGYGPEGIAMLVDTTTDNRNRTVAEVRHIFDSHGGSLGTEGSVAWQFDEKGLVVLKCAKLKKSEQFGKTDEEILCDRDKVTLELFDVDGVDDVRFVDIAEEDGYIDGLEVYCIKEDLFNVRTKIEKLGYIITFAEIVKAAQSPIEVSDEVVKKIQKLSDALEDYDDVQAVWTNLAD